MTMIWSGDVSACNGGRTKEALWKHLQRSIELVFASRDENGQLLADGYRGVFIGIA